MKPTTETAPMSRAWWLRGDFFLLWTGQGVSELGTQFSTIALQLLAVATLRASPLTLGALSAARYLPFIFLAALVGAWLDGKSKRRAMMIADFSRAFLIALVPLLYLVHHISITALILVSLAGGVFRVLFDVANQAFLPLAVQQKQLVAANTVLSNTLNVARVSGPGLAGALVQTVGAPLVLVADAASFLVNGVALSRMTVDRESVATPQASLLRRVTLGLRCIRSTADLPGLLLSSSISNFALMSIQSVVVVFQVRVLHLPAWEIGIIAGADAVGALAGANCAGWLRERLGRARAMHASYAVVLAGTALIASAGGTRVIAGLGLAAGYLLWGAGLGAFNVLNISQRQEVTPPELMGTVMGAWRTVLFGALPLGALAGGGLSQLLGLRAGLLLGVVANALALIALLRLVGGGSRKEVGL